MDELKNNEQDEAIQDASKKHYILGILGALIGGFIASIPWILMYVYGNMILSLLAILVAIGALKGYQILKGKIDKKLPVIITVVSLLAIIIATLVIIPMLLIAKEGLTPSVYNFKLLYSNTEFKEAIIHDLIISVIFTILGISGVVANVNKQIKNSEEPLNEIKISSTIQNREDTENADKKPKKSAKIWIIVIIAIIAVVSILAILDDNEPSRNNYNNNTTTQGQKTEHVYKLDKVGMKVEAPINMTLVSSDADLDYVLGEDSHEIYEFAIYNQDDLISCFVQTATSEEVDNYYKTLKKSFEEDSNYQIISDYKKEKISGFEFTTLEAQTEYNGEKFNDLCLGYYNNGEFVFFEYTYLTENSNNSRKVLENTIKKD